MVSLRQARICELFAAGKVSKNAAQERGDKARAIGRRIAQGDL